MSLWTLTYNGVEQPAAAWGLNAAPCIGTRDRSPTEIRFRMAGAAPELALPFPFKAQVVIRSNRTLIDGQWSVVSGPAYVFTGYLTTQLADVDGRRQGVELVFQDAIWLLQNTTFQQLWNIASAPNSPDYVSRIVLFMDINSWTPNTYQSVQWQINQIIAYAAACGINIAAGTIDYSGWFLNYYHCRAVSCWDALLKCLEPIPDAKVWIDGSPATPVLHVRTRANLAALTTPVGTGPGPITLPYKGRDPAGRAHYSTHGFTPRPDLIPPQVVLQYQINNTRSGKPAPAWTNDVYPASVGGGADGQMPFALVCPIDLLGANVTTETGTLDCQPLVVTAAQTGYSLGSTNDHAAKRAWWASKRGGEQDKLADYRVRFGAWTIGDATVVDDNGNPVNLDFYPNRIVRGTYHAWMSSGGAPVRVIRAHIKVSVQFSEYDVAGSSETDATGNLVRSANAHDLHCHVTLTNAPAGVQTFVGDNYTALGETPVAGLAQNIYNSRATLDYDGVHEIIDPGIPNGVGRTQPLQQLIGHWNVLNFSGGNPAWANANMTIAGTEIDLVANHIRIEVGPGKHLQPQDWSSMLQFFRYRRLYLDSSVRATGYLGANNNVDMALNTPDGNTVPGLAVDQKQGLLAPDAVQPGLSNLITSDATTGQITVAQQPTAGGAAYTTGLIPPVYGGAGSPTSGTLIAGAYYRVGCWYRDTIANALWVFTVAGDSGASAWAQLSGGGGAQRLRVKDNLGACLVCRSWDGATEGSADIHVALAPELQCTIAGYVENGVAYTCTYTLPADSDASGMHFAVRTVTGSDGSSETDDIDSPYLLNTEIYAVPMASQTLNMQTCAVMDLNVAGRCWASR